MNVTIKDIADVLEISPSAVSLALNGKKGVSDSTRERITNTAIEMGYLPSRQFLPTPSSSNIRFIIFLGDSDIVTEISFYSIVLQGIEAKAKKLGYNILVDYLRRSEEEIKINTFLQDTVGIIILGTELQENDFSKIFISKCSSHCPVIILDNILFESSYDCIVTNNALGARQAIDFLIECGHTKIGYLTSKQRILNFTERALGVKQTIEQHPEVSFEEIPVTFSTTKAAHEITEWLKNTSELPTAFFAESDIIAFGAMQAFGKFGLRVPEDVSIIGFDDMPACKMVSPPLTTIHVSKIHMGILAMDLLHKRITKAYDTFPTHRSTLSTSIRIRKSVTNQKKER